MGFTRSSAGTSHGMNDFRILGLGFQRGVRIGWWPLQFCVEGVLAGCKSKHPVIREGACTYQGGFML